MLEELKTWWLQVGEDKYFQVEAPGGKTQTLFAIFPERGVVKYCISCKVLQSKWELKKCSDEVVEEAIQLTK